MTKAEAKKVKVGDRINWKAGGNGCSADSGTVCLDPRTDNLYVLWDHPEQGERTYFVDSPALEHLEKA